MASQAIPKNLQVFLSTLGASISKTTTRLVPQGKSSGFTPGEFTRFYLQENAIVDLHSLNLMFLASTTSTSGFAGLPRHSSSLLSRVNVYVGGLQVGSNITEYGSLYNALANISLGEDKLIEMGVYEASGNAATPASNTTNRRLCINNWVGGILEGTSGRFIDTSLTGSIMIELQWAPASVLVASTGAAGCSYTIDDVYLIAESIQFEGNLYSNLLMSKLATGSPLVYPFKCWHLLTSQTGSSGGTVPFSVNSRSIDVLAATLRSNTYDAANAALPSGAGNSAYYHFISDGSNTRFHFAVNGTQMPQWSASTADAYVLTRQAFDGSSGNRLFTNNIQSTTAWEGGNFLFGQSLCHHASPDEHLMSGLNTQGTATQIYFTYSGGATSAGTRPLILVGCTSVLEVWPGRQILFVA